MSKPTRSKPPRTRPAKSSPGEQVRHEAVRGKTAPETIEAHEKLAKIAGLQAVTALFQRDPSQVIRLYYAERMKNAVGGFCAQMARMHRPYRLVEEDELEKVSGTVLHGGVVAAALPRGAPELEIGAVRNWARAGEPLLILDGVGNPHNLGAIARTMAFFGLRYLLLSDRPDQAGLSDAAHRIAEGGLEHIEVYRAPGLPRFLKQLRESYRVAGTALSGKAMTLSELPADPRPLALVLGNEERGLSGETLAACEVMLIIPGTGQVQSLNVSATAAILIHGMAEKRQGDIKPRKDAGPLPDRRKKEHHGGVSKPMKRRGPEGEGGSPDRAARKRRTPR